MVELVEEPQALLRPGQRQGLGAVGQGECAGLGAGGGVDLGGEGSEAGVGEQLAQRYVHGQGLTQAGDELHGQQGVTAEFEEVVVPADPFHAEQVLPDLGDGLFGRPFGAS
ncbi:hypothetical protein NG831_10635 [Xanthomonas sacchari]|nr:hypothetical protein [Xanthomonas sacchari]UYK68519.1 hypothetical protein NG831_10635 [Xanthomonas sacchari]